MEYFLDFDLPSSLIAVSPSEKRGDDRILVLKNGALVHTSFEDSLLHLKKGDLLVFNNSKVFKARLSFASQEKEGELLLIERLSPNTWTAMVKKARRYPEGTVLHFGALSAVVGKSLEEGLRGIIFDHPFSHEDADAIGQVPLPPYIIRQRKKQAVSSYTKADEERYQTVFAKRYGSVAAPTASLRFTPKIIEDLQKRGVIITEITLHVGIGTFKPMDCKPEHFLIHSEYAHISQESANLIAQVKKDGGRIVAAGTTACRALEASGGKAFDGRVDIFIKPPYVFKTVDALITNFHLPQSTLLLLVQALAGIEQTKKAYLEAIAKQYKFFSYGDGMFILP